MAIVKPIIKTFSIKNFLADLPSMLNANFEAITNMLSSVFDYSKNLLKVTSIETNTANITTLNASEITVIVDGNPVSLNELVNRVKELENKINEIQ